MPRIIGISGVAGSGKDAVAEVLVDRYSFVRVAMADPMKRMVRTIWPFEEDQLWGPSHRRAEPPPGLDRPSAREALQLLGTEWGRKLDQDVWIRMALVNAKKLLQNQNYVYSPSKGLVEGCGVSFGGVVISDVRFSNEAHAIKKMAGEVWRVDRPGTPRGGPVGGVPGHSTERGLPPGVVDQVIMNNKSLEDLFRKIDLLMERR